MTVQLSVGYVQKHINYRPKFHSKSLADKKKVVETYKLCWNCLARGHGVKQCKLKIT